MARFTAMTWNVENLFPPGYRISETRTVTQEEYDAKLDYLTDVIRTVQPDVLALQELGGRTADDRQAFDDLAERLGDLLPHRALSAHPDHRGNSESGIRVGFLSRLAIVDTEEIVDFPPGELSSVANWDTTPNDDTVTRLSRGALRIEVATEDGARLHLVTAHLKSKLVTYPSRTGGAPRFDTNDEDERARGIGLGLLRRTAEATAVRTCLNGLMSQPNPGHVVVLGDLNDEPRAATTQLMLGPEDGDVNMVDRRDPVRLYNLLDVIPLKGKKHKDLLTEAQRRDVERWGTRIYNGRGEVIDHILVSRGLLGTPERTARDEWAVKEVCVMSASITGESIGTNPVERAGRERPDHAPVYARFEL